MCIRHANDVYMSQYDLRSVESPKCPNRRFYCHGSWVSESVESPIGESTGRIPDLSMVLTMCDTLALGTHVWYYITSLSLATSANWCQVMEWQFWVKMFDRYCLLDGFVLYIKWYLLTNILKLYRRRNNIKKGVIVNIFYSNYLFLYIHRDRKIHMVMVIYGHIITDNIVVHISISLRMI